MTSIPFDFDSLLLMSSSSESYSSYLSSSQWNFEGCYLDNDHNHSTTSLVHLATENHPAESHPLPRSADSTREDIANRYAQIDTPPPPPISNTNSTGFDPPIHQTLKTFTDRSDTLYDHSLPSNGSPSLCNWKMIIGDVGQCHECCQQQPRNVIGDDDGQLEIETMRSKVTTKLEDNCTRSSSLSSKLDCDFTNNEIVSRSPIEGGNLVSMDNNHCQLSDWSPMSTGSSPNAIIGQYPSTLPFNQSLTRSIAFSTLHPTIPTRYECRNDSSSIITNSHITHSTCASTFNYQPDNTMFNHHVPLVSNLTDFNSLHQSQLTESFRVAETECTSQQTNLSSISQMIGIVDPLWNHANACSSQSINSGSFELTSQEDTVTNTTTLLQQNTLSASGLLTNMSYPIDQCVKKCQENTATIDIYSNYPTTNRHTKITAVESKVTQPKGSIMTELASFAFNFKQRRMKLGITQAEVGQALGQLELTDFGCLSQSTICRFESLTLSYNNMLILKPLLEAWLKDMEQQRVAYCRQLMTASANQWSSYSTTNQNASDALALTGLAVVDQSAGLVRRRRTSITEPERRTLEACFKQQPKPSGLQLGRIASQINLRKSVVRVWFCNQRQKLKRMQSRHVASVGSSGGASRHR